MGAGQDLAITSQMDHKWAMVYLDEIDLMKW